MDIKEQVDIVKPDTARSFVIHGIILVNREDSQGLMSVLYASEMDLDPTEKSKSNKIRNLQICSP